MATEEQRATEPVIWFEGTLIRDPQPHGGHDDWLLEALVDPDGNGRKITIHASGGDHSENIGRNAHKGARLMVKGTAGDEESGIDVTPDGMTTVTPLTSPKDAAQADGDNAKTGTSPDGARITSRKTLYERFKTKLKANLDERKQ